MLRQQRIMTAWLLRIDTATQHNFKHHIMQSVFSSAVRQDEAPCEVKEVCAAPVG
jgi:hypothetical protein